MHVKIMWEAICPAEKMICQELCPMLIENVLYYHENKDSAHN